MLATLLVDVTSFRDSSVLGLLEGSFTRLFSNVSRWSSVETTKTHYVTLIRTATKRGYFLPITSKHVVEPQAKKITGRIK